MASSQQSVSAVLNELVSLTEAYKVLSKLRLKRSNVTPRRRLVTWKGTCEQLEQSEHCRETKNEIKYISSKLLMCEFQMLKKQKEFESILLEKEKIINQQQKTILKLKRKLKENNIYFENDDDSDNQNEVQCDSRGGSGGSGNRSSVTGRTDDASNAENDAGDLVPIDRNEHLPSGAMLRKIDELDNDSDSAVVMEDSDCLSECPSSSTMSGHVVAISRSVSDAIQLPSRSRATSAQTQHVTTYNRVMSNHRSVTKPKDVKYKRINKAKSKSLEELRDKLKNWIVVSND